MNRIGRLVVTKIEKVEQQVQKQNNREKTKIKRNENKMIEQHEKIKELEK